MLKLLRAFVLMWPCACHQDNPRFTHDEQPAATTTGTSTDTTAPTTGTSTGSSESGGESSTGATGGMTGGMTTEPTGDSSTGDASTGSSSTASESTDSTGSTGFCGDGLLDEFEACDDGPLNALDAACLPDCTQAACGDGNLQAGVELCDDGDLEPHNACNELCKPTPTDVDLLVGDVGGVLGTIDGTLFEDECEVLIGFAGLLSEQLGLSPSVIGGICGQLELAVAGDAFVIKVSSAGQTLPSYGSNGNYPWILTCPSDQVIVGITGEIGNQITALGFICAPLVITPEQDGTYTLAVGTSTVVGPIGNPDLGQPEPDATCPIDQVGVGQRVYDIETMLVGVGLTCRAPILL